MKEQDRNWVSFAVTVAAWILVLGFIASSLCYEYGKSRVKNEAVDAGAAKWGINPSTGKTEFQWVKPETK